MPRITVELTSEDHRALKLLSIVEGKTLGGVLREAIQGHLQHKGAHNLEVTVQRMCSGVGTSRRTNASLILHR